MSVCVCSVWMWQKQRDPSGTEHMESHMPNTTKSLYTIPMTQSADWFPSWKHHHLPSLIIHHTLEGPPSLNVGDQSCSFQSLGNLFSRVTITNITMLLMFALHLNHTFWSYTSLKKSYSMVIVSDWSKVQS